jgi:hypothetical protein
MRTLRGFAIRARNDIKYLVLLLLSSDLHKDFTTLKQFDCLLQVR